MLIIGAHLQQQQQQQRQKAASFSSYPSGEERRKISEFIHSFCCAAERLLAIGRSRNVASHFIHSSHFAKTLPDRSGA